jgi:glycosyltransferase involved in cell wall biosynthesis
MNTASFGGRGSKPLVSVGLPVHNGERFLVDALDSLLSQDLEDIEVIISDNASVDSTAAIAQHYRTRDARVRYVRHAQQRGAAFNFNYVARAASGRYFKWAAHDDVCAPAFLSTCVAALEADRGVVLAYPLASEIDEKGARLRDFPAYRFADERRPSDRVRSFLRERPACLEVYGVMRRRALLETGMIGPFSSSDGVLLLEMMLRGRFELVPERSFFCRTHADRSLIRYRGSRRQWYDASAAPGRGFPEWRLTAELLRGVQRAPIARTERARALRHVGVWALAKSPSLLRDVAATAKATLGRGRRPSPGSAPPIPSAQEVESS